MQGHWSQSQVTLGGRRGHPARLTELTDIHTHIHTGDLVLESGVDVRLSVGGKQSTLRKPAQRSRETQKGPRSAADGFEQTETV